jgi:hypothetical protein
MVTKEFELNDCCQYHHQCYPFALLSEVWCTSRISDNATMTLRGELHLDKAHCGYIVTEQNAGTQGNN